MVLTLTTVFVSWPALDAALVALAAMLMEQHVGAKPDQRCRSKSFATTLQSLVFSECLVLVAAILWSYWRSGRAAVLKMLHGDFWQLQGHPPWERMAMVWHFVNAFWWSLVSGLCLMDCSETPLTLPLHDLLGSKQAVVSCCILQTLVRMPLSLVAFVAYVKRARACYIIEVLVSISQVVGTFLYCSPVLSWPRDLSRRLVVLHMALVWIVVPAILAVRAAFVTVVAMLEAREANGLGKSWVPLVFKKSEQQLRYMEIAISKAFMFAHLDSKTRTIAANAFEVKHVALGLVLFKEGSTVGLDEPSMFVLETGSFDVYMVQDPQESGRGSKVFTYSRPGSFFGELALLQGGPRFATLVASADSTLWSITRRSYVQCDANAATVPTETAEVALRQVALTRANSSDRLSFLRDAVSKAFMFAWLSPTEIDQILSSFQEHQVTPGSEVFREGVEVGCEDPAMYVIESGRFHIYMTPRESGLCPDGPGDKVATYSQAGCFFGELALLFGGHRQMTVVAASTPGTPLILWSINRKSFDDCVSATDGRTRLLHCDKEDCAIMTQGMCVVQPSPAEAQANLQKASVLQVAETAPSYAVSEATSQLPHVGVQRIKPAPLGESPFQSPQKIQPADKFYSTGDQSIIEASGPRASSGRSLPRGTCSCGSALPPDAQWLTECRKCGAVRAERKALASEGRVPAPTSSQPPLGTGDTPSSSHSKDGGGKTGAAHAVRRVVRSGKASRRSSNESQPSAQATTNSASPTVMQPSESLLPEHGTTLASPNGVLHLSELDIDSPKARSLLHSSSESSSSKSTPSESNQSNGSSQMMDDYAPKVGETGNALGVRVSHTYDCYDPDRKRLTSEQMNDRTVAAISHYRNPRRGSRPGSACGSGRNTPRTDGRATPRSGAGSAASSLCPTPRIPSPGSDRGESDASDASDSDAIVSAKFILTGITGSSRSKRSRDKRSEASSSVPSTPTSGRSRRMSVGIIGGGVMAAIASPLSSARSTASNASSVRRASISLPGKKRETSAGLNEKALSQKQMDTCKCGNVFVQDAIFCPKCGSKRQVSPKPLPAKTVEVEKAASKVPKAHLDVITDSTDSALSENPDGLSPATRTEIITNWGVLVGRIVTRSAPEVISKLAVKKRAQHKKARAPCSHRFVEKLVSEVVENVRSLTREVAAQPIDILDHEWDDDENILRTLFGNSPTDTLMYLANMARKVFASQPVVVDAPTPCRVYGDLHGQLRDLLLFFYAFGMPGSRGAPVFVFNGDFVDRGRHQVEVVGVLFALKIHWPEQVFLLRGNHEERTMNEKFGFKAQVLSRLGKSSGSAVYRDIHGAFDQLPLACVVAERALVVHGGIGDGRWLLSALMNVRRPLGDIMAMDPTMKWIWNILWSDPIEDDNDKVGNTFGLHASPRGLTGVLFGWNVTKTFCARNGLSLIIRSHQSKQDGIGIDIMHENQLVRVFTARDYEGGRCANDGAVLLLTEEPGGIMKVKAQVVKSLTKVRRARGLIPMQSGRRSSRPLSNREMAELAASSGSPTSSHGGSTPRGSSSQQRRSSTSKNSLGRTSTMPVEQASSTPRRNSVAGAALSSRNASATRRQTASGMTAADVGFGNSKHPPPASKTPSRQRRPSR